MANLFCYGTLMYGPLLEALTGREHKGEAATLPDYACYGVKAAAYPAIVEQQGAVVSGQLVRDIPAGSWLALDRYEGEFYRREEVRVMLADGTETDAVTYVMRPRFRSRLSRRAWQYNRDAQAYARAQCARLRDEQVFGEKIVE